MVRVYKCQCFGFIMLKGYMGYAVILVICDMVPQKIFIKISVWSRQEIMVRGGNVKRQGVKDSISQELHGLVIGSCMGYGF